MKTKEEFEKFYQTIMQKPETEERFLLINVLPKIQKAVLFGSSMYMNAVNYGSDIGVRINSLDDGKSYFQYLSMFISSPYILNEIEFRTEGYTIFRICHCASNGHEIIESVKFEDKKIISIDEFKSEEIKAIGANNYWTVNMSPNQEIQVIIRGRRLKWF